MLFVKNDTSSRSGPRRAQLLSWLKNSMCILAAKTMSINWRESLTKWTLAGDWASPWKYKGYGINQHSVKEEKGKERALFRLVTSQPSSVRRQGLKLTVVHSLTKAGAKRSCQTRVIMGERSQQSWKTSYLVIIMWYSSKSAQIKW